MEIVYIDITRGVLFDSWQGGHRMNLRPALFYCIQKKEANLALCLQPGFNLRLKLNLCQSGRRLKGGRLSGWDQYLAASVVP